LSYDFFTHAGTIGVRSVDEIDSQFDSTPQNPDGLSPICRLAPNSISRDSHRAESQARNTKIVSDQEFTGLFSECLVSLYCGLVILHMFSLSNDENWGVELPFSFGVRRRKRRRKKRTFQSSVP